MLRISFLKYSYFSCEATFLLPYVVHLRNLLTHARTRKYDVPIPKLLWVDVLTFLKKQSIDRVRKPSNTLETLNIHFKVVCLLIDSKSWLMKHVFFCTKDPQILRTQMIPWSFNKTPVVLGSRVWFSFETKPTWWPPVPPLQLWLKTLRALQQGMEKQSTGWTLGMATGYKINTIYIIYTLYIYQHVYRWYMYLLFSLLIYSFIHLCVYLYSLAVNQPPFSKLRPYLGGFKLLVAALRIVYWRGSPTEGDGLCWKVSSPVVDAFWRFVSWGVSGLKIWPSCFR